MVLDQFYRKDRKYWYKLVMFGDSYYITYDYRKAKIGTVILIYEYNKKYVFKTLTEALHTFNSWRRKYE